MVNEIEAVGIAGAADEAAPRPVRAESQPAAACRNCGAPTPGRYCARCGQLNADYHRPLISLVGEAIGDFFALDGRLARTLPTLILRPGRVTRGYLDGKRARYVPPFRLYILASLVFFATLFGVLEAIGVDEFDARELMEGGVDGAVQAEVSLGDRTTEPDPESWFNADGTVNRDVVYAEFLPDDVAADPDEFESGKVVIDHVINAYENQTLLSMIMQNWAPRLALLLFPVFTLFLALAYAWWRGVYVYDHVITALHFQTFLYLLYSALMLLGLAIGWIVMWAVFLGPPIYLYRMLRETYRSGRIMSLLRTFALLALTSITVTTLFIAVVMISVTQV